MEPVEVGFAGVVVVCVVVGVVPDGVTELATDELKLVAVISVDEDATGDVCLGVEAGGAVVEVTLESSLKDADPSEDWVTVCAGVDTNVVPVR